MTACPRPVNELPAPIKLHIATELQREVLRRHHNSANASSGSLSSDEILANASPTKQPFLNGNRKEQSVSNGKIDAIMSSQRGSRTAAALAALNNNAATNAPRMVRSRCNILHFLEKFCLTGVWTNTNRRICLAGQSLTSSRSALLQTLTAGHPSASNIMRASPMLFVEQCGFETYFDSFVVISIPSSVMSLPLTTRTLHGGCIILV